MPKYMIEASYSPEGVEGVKNKVDAAAKLSVGYRPPGS